jgi:hypothetical protein
LPQHFSSAVVLLKWRAQSRRLCTAHLEQSSTLKLGGNDELPRKPVHRRSWRMSAITFCSRALASGTTRLSRAVARSSPFARRRAVGAVSCSAVLVLGLARHVYLTLHRRARSTRHLLVAPHERGVGNRVGLQLGGVAGLAYL